MDFLSVTLQLLEGFGTTCELFILTLVLSLPLGLVVAFGSMSKFKPLRWLVRGFVWIIRGTPLMLQLFIVFFVPGIVFGVSLQNRLFAALIAFVINYSCYFSVIYRGGIEGIPVGQYEAGQVLGMTKTRIFIRIILPQVIKRIIPPMSNEIITLVKDTSLAKVISVMDIIFVAESLMSLKGLLWPMFYTAVFYLVFVGVLTVLFNFLEKKLSYYKV